MTLPVAAGANGAAMRILSRYIIREIIPPFCLGFFVFTALVLLDRVLRLVNLIMEKDLPLALAGKALLLYLPFTITLTIPMALLMATLMAFGRLAADSELLALRASGVNLVRLVLPVHLLGLLLALATLGINDAVATRSFVLFKNLLHEISHRSKLISIQPEITMDLGDYRLYVKAADNERQTMSDIRMEELSGERNLIIAKRGHWYREKDEALVFILSEGAVHRSDQSGSYYSSPFGEFTFKVNLADPGLAEREVGLRENSLLQLRDLILATVRERGDPTPYLVEFHKKLAVPFACLAFAIGGAPLGMMARRSGRSIGFGLSLFLLFGYYLLLSGGESLALKGTLPPGPAIWFSNVLFITLGLLLTRKLVKQ